jgi:hypothetical protein
MFTNHQRFSRSVTVIGSRQYDSFTILPLGDFATFLSILHPPSTTSYERLLGEHLAKIRVIVSVSEAAKNELRAIIGSQRYMWL